MKTTQMMMMLCCLMACILSAISSGQSWRPQGRFGKRLSQGRLEDDSAAADFGLSRIHEIPIEAFFSKRDIGQLKSKPRLCSLSGVQGYPLCGMVVSSSTGQNDDLSSLFDM
nr:cardio-excitory peptide-1 precursor [Lissachatina fulica]